MRVVCFSSENEYMLKFFFSGGSFRPSARFRILRCVGESARKTLCRIGRTGTIYFRQVFHVYYISIVRRMMRAFPINVTSFFPRKATRPKIDT